MSRSIEQEFELAKGGMVAFVCQECGASVIEESGKFLSDPADDTYRKRHMEWHKTLARQVRFD